jgi:hypothetical protein
MKDLKLVIRETGDTSPGMDGAVHINFDDSADEPCLPYVEREVAEEMVRRWNTQPDLLAALELCSAELFAQCGDKERAMRYVEQARAAIAKATNP